MKLRQMPQLLYQQADEGIEVLYIDIVVLRAEAPYFVKYCACGRPNLLLFM